MSRGPILDPKPPPNPTALVFILGNGTDLIGDCALSVAERGRRQWSKHGFDCHAETQELIATQIDRPQPSARAESISCAHGAPRPLLRRRPRPPGIPGKISARVPSQKKCTGAPSRKIGRGDPKKNRPDGSHTVNRRKVRLIKPPWTASFVVRGRRGEGRTGSPGLGRSPNAMMCLLPRSCRGSASALHALSVGWLLALGI
jgi:hypothetical protein